MNKGEIISFIILLFSLGWILGGRRRRPTHLENTCDSLLVERDTQARTIEGQRQTIRELEKEANAFRITANQANENWRTVEKDRNDLRTQLDKWALAIRSCSPATRKEIQDNYDQP